MKYTIDGPDQAIDATISGADYDLVKVAVLVHLPGADARTAAMFGRHAAKTWNHQPKYAASALTDGAPVIRWEGKVIDIRDAADLKALVVGRLKSYGVSQWALDTDVRLVNIDDA